VAVSVGDNRREKEQLKKLCYLLVAAIIALLVIFPAKPLKCDDMSGKWGIGLHGGAYKLGLTDHSDIWTAGWLVNGGLKYGLSSHVSIGVEGNLMRTYLANLSEGNRAQDGAELTTSNMADGPRQRAFIAGLSAEYHFMPEKRWSPFVSIGTGMYMWKWADKDGKTLVSTDPSLVGTGTPSTDLDAAPYDLSDKELYASAGLGLEFFPSQTLSFEVGAKFRYLTHLLSDFKDRKDIVGTKPGQLDLPRGVGEVYAGLTLHFGGGEKCPLLSCEASGNPTSGNIALSVQFTGSMTGGCPPFAYSWNFGDGGNSGDMSPSHDYQTAGDYTASLTVTDSEGSICQKSVSIIAVSCSPLACTASANPTSGFAPVTVKFSTTVSGGCPPYTYSWDIGDGGSSSEQNPSHLIESAGSFTANVTVTDSKGNIGQNRVSYTISEAEFIPTPEKPLILKGVNFESDKAILLESSKDILDRVAVSLIEHPNVKVEVAGHCDAQNSDAHNLKLSDARAKTVRDYLIRKGVKAEQLEAKGYGESEPIASNDTAAGRAENRRVELKRIR
jgi:outer membrane protein OmpA-like peptidoglycan-associated protein/opacity protein-like surface antigen